MWRVPMELLSPDFAVLRYDFLGHGESHNPAGARKISDYVDQLMCLIHYLGVARFALVGFSMGALIAQAFASQQPDRLTHLGLLHSVYQRTEAQCLGVRARYHITREHGSMADDSGSSAAMARALCRDLPNSQLIINQGHRHMAPVEHATVITAQLRSRLM